MSDYQMSVLIKNLKQSLERLKEMRNNDATRLDAMENRLRALERGPPST